MNMSMNIPTHPFVECNIEGVNAHALIDTGSMKSFIRQDIYNTIDFEGTRLGKVNEQCKSITGDPLNLSGKLNATSIQGTVRPFFLWRIVVDLIIIHVFLWRINGLFLM